MEIYNYDDNGVFVGAYTARLDPLESTDETPIYLIPRNSTSIQPPALGTDEAAVFSGGEWAVQEDHRGKTAYDKVTCLGSEIAVVGEIPAGLTLLVPNNNEEWDGSAWIPSIEPLATSQDNRRDELRVDCANAIVGWFASDALGTEHNYDCRIEDQGNIRMRQAVSTVDSLPKNIWAHDGVEFTREPHTTAQLDQVMIDMEAHIEIQQAKLAGLIATVNAVGTGDDAADAITIAAIVW